MGSVISDCVCPICGYEHAISDFYYRTGEEYIHCGRCGYYHGYDESGKEVKHKGIGSYRVMFGGGGTVGSIENKEHLDEFKTLFKMDELVNGIGDKPTLVEYTFQKDGIWQIHELVSDTISAFPEHPEGYVEE